MKTPTTLLDRPGRVAAVVGAVVALSATTLMAFVAGTASASVPARCVDTVNVRSQPHIDSPIVAVCDAGTETTVGETRNGFVRMIELRGWSAQEFVSVDGAEPGAPRAEQRTPIAPDSSDSDTAGSDTAGSDTAGSDTAGSDTAGRNSTGSNSTGRNSTGSDTAGRNSTGSDTAGSNSTGSNSTGNNSTGSDNSSGDTAAPSSQDRLDPTREDNENIQPGAPAPAMSPLDGLLRLPLLP